MAKEKTGHHWPPTSSYVEANENDVASTSCHDCLLGIVDETTRLVVHNLRQFLFDMMSLIFHKWRCY